MHDGKQEVAYFSSGVVDPSVVAAESRLDPGLAVAPRALKLNTCLKFEGWLSTWSLTRG